MLNCPSWKLGISGLNKRSLDLLAFEKLLRLQHRHLLFFFHLSPSPQKLSLSLPRRDLQQQWTNSRNSSLQGKRATCPTTSSW
jgi:hypothetical protein